MRLFRTSLSLWSLWLFLAACSKPSAPAGEVTEVRIPRGAGGVGFLPLLVMEHDHLIERHAREAGIQNLSVKWIDLGGPSVMNDALLSGSVDFIAAGPPAFLILWDRTQNSAKVLGVAAMASLPMYLNTRADHLKRLDDISARDKIAVTGVKVSIPSIVMQMYAQQKFGIGDVSHFDRFTVTMTHPDAVVALLSGSGAVDAHFTSPPFHQRERKDPHVRTIMTSDDVMGGSATFTMLSTTSAFRTNNPKVYAAVLKALDDAVDTIIADKEDAADILLHSTGEGGFSREEILAVMNDPSVKFTTIPENVMKYAGFMHDIGSISKRPASWKELFFPEVQEGPGKLMQGLAVDGVTLQYPNGKELFTAVDRISFRVSRSDRYVILGPSGCGKSTLLRAIGGYIRPAAGTIVLDGKPVQAPGPDRIFVFQELDQLLPWKTVRENIVFALTTGGKLPRNEALPRADKFIEKVNLTKFAGNYPHTLSGGMKQRVAIARAMAMEPQILLMDEPFAALDALTRTRMQEELLQLCTESAFTVIFVTHSIPEALRIGTRILLLSDHPGRVKAELVNSGLDAAHVHEILFDGVGQGGSMHV